MTAPPDLFDQLAPARRRIVGMLLFGYSRRAIARRMGISEASLRVHLWRTRCQLGCRTEAELLRLAQAHGVKPCQ